jgi:futalosine hydrolase
MVRGLILRMSILLCAATEGELKPTLDYIRQHQLEGRVEVLITGVGLTAATYGLTRRLATRRPSLIIQAGVAGALNPELALAEVVRVRSEVIGDEGVKENGQFHSLFELGLAGTDNPPFLAGRLVNKGIEPYNTAQLRVVDGVTVNQVSTDEEQISYYRDRLGAEIETMEGAALHYTALMEGVPFLQLRAISNYIGERDKRNWKLAEAINRLNEELQTLLTKAIRL